ncbi:ATP-binding protein [Paenibacillus larvae]|uniref:Phage-related protein n=3 Tax=Paenibacillus larvae TaxID=1464 RepID=A0A2L1TWK6_9BACL|nr:ATP-binding protein [Paenibacillus larvae]AVF25071.1 phage-related protein [Paenibacillus larvae subsp. larvae]MDR5606634.1 ATP-binding protein [Paenibacillus larvae]
MSSPISQKPVEANYACHKCKDEFGYFKKSPQIVNGEEWLMDVWVTCDCVEKRRLQRLFQASAITDEFAKKTFDNFKLGQVHEIVREAYAVANEYVRDFDKLRSQRSNSIALLGRPGAGKTHLLMAVANTLLARGIGVVYFPYVEGFNELRKDLDQLDERVRRLQQAEVLFIDDLFKGRSEPTEWQKEQLFAIINYRNLQKLPMLISSERNFAQMVDIDEAIGSRLRDMARGMTVTIIGNKDLNYRMREG